MLSNKPFQRREHPQKATRPRASQPKMIGIGHPRHSSATPEFPYECEMHSRSASTIRGSPRARPSPVIDVRLVRAHHCYSPRENWKTGLLGRRADAKGGRGGVGGFDSSSCAAVALSENVITAFLPGYRGW